MNRHWSIYKDKCNELLPATLTIDTHSIFSTHFQTESHNSSGDEISEKCVRIREREREKRAQNEIKSYSWNGMHQRSFHYQNKLIYYIPNRVVSWSCISTKMKLSSKLFT